jgi:type IV fimbrial biogenesis protein FimT
MRRQQGLNLIELMVALAIFTTLILYAAPNFNQWLQSSRIRTTAEAILAGLQTAKSEAVARNQRVRFQLTSSLDEACTLDTTGRNWVVNLDPDADEDAVEGACGDDPSDTVAPRIVQTRPAGEGSGTAVVEADEASVVFNGVGRLVPLPGDGPIVIRVTNPSGGACAVDDGPMTCLNVVVSPAGQVRMCNPNFPAGDAQAC